MKTHENCPTCGWYPFGRDEEYKVGGSVLCKITDFQYAGGGASGEYWKEHYRCPKCNTRFITDSGT